MNGRTQWLFEAPPILKATPYSNLEYYNPPPLGKADICSGYKPGEEKKSIQAGFLKPTVSLLAPDKLLIADFGVNWRHVKESTKKESLLKAWLNKFENDPNYQLRIIGYSDCVGDKSNKGEKNDKFLREGRAKRVWELLGKSARKRVKSVSAAPLGTYVPGTDNSTVEGRAKNRGVIIEFYAPKPVPTKKPSNVLVWGTIPLPPSEFYRFQKAIVDLESRVVQTASQDPGLRRYLCWIQKLKQPDVDDRIIGWGKICPKTSGAISGMRLPIGSCDLNLGTPINQTVLEKSIRSSSDVDNVGESLGIITYIRASIVVSFEMTSPSVRLENLRRLTDNATRAIDNLDKWANADLGGSSAMPTTYRAIKDWIIKRQNDPKSLYSCF